MRLSGRMVLVLNLLMARDEAVAQIGGVKIGEDVSIGAGTCIDWWTIEDTVVGSGVKIDNQVQIGHNCKIGDNSIICGQVGIVGSTVVGRNCILAGGCWDRRRSSNRAL